MQSTDVGDTVNVPVVSHYSTEQQVTGTHQGSIYLEEGGYRLVNDA